MPKPEPREFRDRVVRVARNREPGVHLGQIAADFGISESRPANRLKAADVEDGLKPGTTAAESAELRDAEKRIRLLEQVGVSPGVAVGWRFCAALRPTCPRPTCRERLHPSPCPLAVVALVRAGAVFHNGELLERPHESGGQTESA